MHSFSVHFSGFVFGRLLFSVPLFADMLVVGTVRAKNANKKKIVRILNDIPPILFKIDTTSLQKRMSMHNFMKNAEVQ